VNGSTIFKRDAHIATQPGLSSVAKTLVLDGKIGDWLAVARMTSSGVWFLAVVNEDSKKKVSLKLDFLPDLEYDAVVYYDDVTAPHFGGLKK